MKAIWVIESRSGSRWYAYSWADTKREALTQARSEARWYRSAQYRVRRYIATPEVLPVREVVSAVHGKG